MGGLSRGSSGSGHPSLCRILDGRTELFHIPRNLGPAVVDEIVVLFDRDIGEIVMDDVEAPFFPFPRLHIVHGDSPLILSIAFYRPDLERPNRLSADAKDSAM